MTTAIVFSRDRPAQLDLLLSSIIINDIPVKPVVLYRATTDQTLEGYVTCHGHHGGVFVAEGQWFKEQFETLLCRATDTVMLLCDDDVFYQSYPSSPQITLQEDVFCFSTRLGENTNYCYPLDQPQEFPATHQHGCFHIWDWTHAQHDFGYPGSIDGTYFRRDHLLEMIRSVHYHNPNSLEETIQQQAHKYYLPKMVCYQQSVLVGMPLNIVNSSHPNRNEQHDLEQINDRYVKGEYISLKTVTPELVNAAHTPFELKWEQRVRT